VEDGLGKVTIYTISRGNCFTIDSRVSLYTAKSYVLNQNCTQKRNATFWQLV